MVDGDGRSVVIDSACSSTILGKGMITINLFKRATHHGLSTIYHGPTAKLPYTISLLNTPLPGKTTLRDDQQVGRIVR